MMNQQNRLRLLGILAALAALIYGPSFFSRGDTSGRVGVHGTVTSGGRPLQSGRIQFTPAPDMSGPAISADVVEGAYSIQAREGVFPGTYEVTLMSTPAAAKGPMKGNFRQAFRENAFNVLPVRWPEPQRILADKADVELNFAFPLPKK
jgi:hypothetical protein